MNSPEQPSTLRLRPSMIFKLSCCLLTAYQHDSINRLIENDYFVIKAAVP